MDNKTKRKLREKISKRIDLSNTRLKDSEYETLNSLIDNVDQYKGKTKTYKKNYREKDYRGNYDVEKTWNYTLESDDDGIRVREDYDYRNDDGDSHSSTTIHNSARQLLNVLRKITD